MDFTPAFSLIMFNDLNIFIALPLERLFDNRQEVKEATSLGWQFFLAEARKRFLIDELLIKNELPTSELDGEILELDNGTSKLGSVLKRSGFRSCLITPFSPDSSDLGSFALGVSHNQFEHFSNLEAVSNSLRILAEHSSFGMVHQVHASDDPGFNLDSSHQIAMTSNEWEEFFGNWAKAHTTEDWRYLGAHRGAPGRPKNYVLERNRAFRSYAKYDGQLARKITAELTVANGISISRIPILMASFSLAKDNPRLLAGLLGIVHLLDEEDGRVSRMGLGNSPYGPYVDVLIDHFVEEVIMYNFVYSRKSAPQWAFATISLRNLSIDYLRYHNLFNAKQEGALNHPHKAFGTNDRINRAEYGLVKALGDMATPIFPQYGIEISTGHVTANLLRASQVWSSPESQRIYKELLEQMLNQKKESI